MLGAKTPPLDAAMGTGEPRLSSRRNDPRASHACQRCRAKKSRCNQQQPCSNCVRHATTCVYDTRRRNARGGRHRAAGRAPTGPSDAQGHGLHPAPVEVGCDPASAPTIPADSRLSANRSSSTHESVLSDFPQGTLSAPSSDVLGDVNQHTEGTEFYGTSSSYVLLSQLLSYAQLHLRPGHADSRRGQEASNPICASFLDESTSAVGDSLTVNSPNTFLGTGTLSVVNLLSTEEELLPPSRARTPPHNVGRAQSVEQTRESQWGAPSDLQNSSKYANHSAVSVSSLGRTLRLQAAGHPSATSHTPSLDRSDLLKTTCGLSLRLAERRIERELVRSFLRHLHFLHPILDSQVFTAQCEERMWGTDIPQDKSKKRQHFVALYNIVVAVGALIASADALEELGPEIKIFQQNWSGSRDSSQKGVFQTLSRIYFRRSRASLGDVFEACSLQSAQTLLLMSLYYQNALRPHACYMYCGMAVRTALAIGLPTESMSCSAADRKAARRTWWCIYSHEIDMCCSSGRRDSLGKPRNYPIPLPRIKGQNVDGATLEDEDYSVAMVNEMVKFAVLLRRISKEIYHDSKGSTMLQKSSIAIEIDALLVAWKSKLPDWLNFDAVAFRGTEWAAKQKLVLHLRYLNARVILHRPFLIDLTRESESTREKHVDLCLDAARKTIRLLYESYAMRPYFRTWWYNSTYMLYAGMIVLYVIMLRHTSFPTSDLVDDVKKSRDILRSMEEASVARRSADLMSEVLDWARACTQEERSLEPDGNRVILEGRQHQGDTQPHDISFCIDDSFSRRFCPGTDFGQDSEALLASLTDPTMLQDFTAVDEESTDLGFSFPSAHREFSFPFDDQDGVFAASFVGWQAAGGTGTSGVGS